jgi:hypothetical protein
MEKQKVEKGFEFGIAQGGQNTIVFSVYEDRAIHSGFICSGG